jgi:hypothetical protein
LIDQGIDLFFFESKVSIFLRARKAGRKMQVYRKDRPSFILGRDVPNESGLEPNQVAACLFFLLESVELSIFIATHVIKKGKVASRPPSKKLLLPQSSHSNLEMKRIALSAEARIPVVTTCFHFLF